MLTMVHTNPAMLEGGVYRVDRKFHVGMLKYAERIRSRVATVNPELSPGMSVMDLIDVPVAELTYDAMTIKVDRSWYPLASEAARLEAQIKKSKLLYDGDRLGTPRLARSLGVPYILMLEYDLATQMTVAANQTKGLRPAVRAARCAWRYVTTDVPDMRSAHSVHCNGYPMFDAAGKHNANTLLYLDSRMSAEMIITQERLSERLMHRKNRPLRLLYSGRYEGLKGADDAVRVAVDCVNRGIDVEMHCYGQGKMQADMRRIAASARLPGKIHIHDAIPYPELVEISRTFDVFICCHIQGDPSCTYLESLGAGLPIVGYANRMWKRLSGECGAGRAVSVGHPEKLADEIERLAADFPSLAELSQRARAFALEHSFEREFTKRIDALNAALT